jgi:hypothetical protein
VQFKPGLLQNPNPVKIAYLRRSGIFDIRLFGSMKKPPADLNAGLTGITVLDITAGSAGRSPGGAQPRRGSHISGMGYTEIYMGLSEKNIQPQRNTEFFSLFLLYSV